MRHHIEKETELPDFEQLVKEYKSTIYSVCYMFTDTKPEADDLFQEVLTRLWLGRESYRGDASLKSWVYRVSMNTCISYKRKKRIKTIGLEFSSAADVPDNPAGRQARMLHDRITKLEPFDRAIIMLWLEDMPYEEIAAIVGITPKAVGVRLVRIKEKLKSL